MGNAQTPPPLLQPKLYKYSVKMLYECLILGDVKNRDILPEILNMVPFAASFSILTEYSIVGFSVTRDLDKPTSYVKCTSKLKLIFGVDGILDSHYVLLDEDQHCMVQRAVLGSKTRLTYELCSRN